MLQNLIVMLFVSCITSANVPGSSHQNSNINGASRDYKTMRVGTDKHQFGVEVEEHKQFHHTTTEEDGVRLGCYGHVQQGKTYVTRYVADARGYRIVPYADFITVYPKSGSESRKASFSRDLRPDQEMSEHVKFYFPEGCQKEHVEVVGSESRVVITAVTPPSKVRSTTDASSNYHSSSSGSSFYRGAETSTVTPAPPSQDDEIIDQCGPREPPQCECTCTY